LCRDCSANERSHRPTRTLRPRDRSGTEAAGNRVAPRESRPSVPIHSLPDASVAERGDQIVGQAACHGGAPNRALASVAVERSQPILGAEPEESPSDTARWPSRRRGPGPASAPRGREMHRLGGRCGFCAAPTIAPRRDGEAIRTLHHRGHGCTPQNGDWHKLDFTGTNAAAVPGTGSKVLTGTGAAARSGWLTSPRTVCKHARFWRVRRRWRGVQCEGSTLRPVGNPRTQRWGSGIIVALYFPLSFVHISVG